jgi:hypothetical protein
MWVSAANPRRDFYMRVMVKSPSPRTNSNRSLHKLRAQWGYPPFDQKDKQCLKAGDVRNVSARPEEKGKSGGECQTWRKRKRIAPSTPRSALTGQGNSDRDLKPASAKVVARTASLGMETGMEDPEVGGERAGVGDREIKGAGARGVEKCRGGA